MRQTTVPTSARHRRTYWVLQVVGWSLYGLSGVLLFTAFAHYVPGIVAVEICVAVMLLLTSHLLRFCIRRYGWLQRPLPALLGRLALTNAGLAIGAQIVINLLLTYIVRPDGLQAQQNQGLMFLGYILNTYFVLWLWAALYVGLHYLRGYRQAEIDKWKLTAAVREAEMRTLKAQLNPHFLFNGLNNIRALVTEDPAGARTMMTHLSDLLRHTIQFSDAEQVTVARELALVRHYLALEALQLEERLAYSLDVDPAALPALLLPMTLQLLVENAIKHGLAPRPAGGHITLTVGLAEDGAVLLATVRNTGRYRPTEPAGVGLRNIRERLALLFGGAASLTISNDPALPDTVTARLRLPLLLEEARSEKLGARSETVRDET